MLTVSKDDNQLFAEVVVSAYPAFLGLARRLVKDPERAKDSVQEALLSVWQAWQRGERETRRRKLRGLLLAAVAKQCKAEESQEIESPPLSPATIAVQNLSDRDRQMLKLHFQEGLSITETARRLNLSRARLRKRIHKVLFQLKQLLPAEETVQLTLSS